jgi:hypothetical protein
MGGQAFAELTTKDGRPVRVPRMPPQLYKTMSKENQMKLETLFERVVIPRDAPGKTDYGDIDFLVGSVRPHIARCDIWTIVKSTLGAELHLPRGGSHSFAVPHPTNPEAYVQVDVELSPGDDTPESIELFEWTRFMKGDSDLLQIIGISHRPLGLTCNDQGLHIRVEEIEPYNRKKALLFLTRDPNKAMDFYGFDVDKYWAGFTDENDLFDWASSGRFFSYKVMEGRVEKSNDRSRHAKRPMYRRFIEEFMPAQLGKRNACASWTRQELLREALNVFDKQAEFDTMMEEHRRKESEEELWKDIRAIIPVEGNSLSTALKGLRRWVVFHGGEPYIAQEANLGEYARWSVAMKEGTRQELLDWVGRNWTEAKSLEKARANTVREASKAA